MTFFYNLNDQKRVCRCHYESNCETIPPEDKSEDQLIWSLVNYQEKVKMRREVTKSLKKWFKRIHCPRLNLIYNLHDTTINLKGATIIHLCFLLNNDSAYLLRNMAVALSQVSIEADSFKLFHGKDIDRYVRATKPDPTMTAMAFYIVGNVFKFEKYLDKLQFMIEFNSGDQNWGYNVSQYYSMCSYTRIEDVMKQIKFKQKDPNMEAARKMAKNIEAIPVETGRDFYVDLGRKIDDSSLTKKGNWIKMLSEKLLLNTQMTSKTFWATQGNTRQFEYLRFCDLAVLLYSNRLDHTQVKSRYLITNLITFIPMILCPASGNELRVRTRATLEVFKALTKLLVNLDKYQFTPEQLLGVNNQDLTNLLTSYHTLHTSWAGIGQCIRWVVESKDPENPILSELAFEVYKGVTVAIRLDYNEDTFTSRLDLKSINRIYDTFYTLLEGIFREKDNYLVFYNEEMDATEKEIYKQLSVEVGVSGLFGTDEERTRNTMKRVSHLRSQLPLPSPAWLSHFEGKHLLSLIQTDTIILSKDETIFRRKKKGEKANIEDTFAKTLYNHNKALIMSDDAKKEARGLKEDISGQLMMELREMALEAMRD